MASYNRIVLAGHLTRAPELSHTQAGTALCKFGIATNRKWKNKDGVENEEVCFVDCTLFGKSAEAFNQYMGRGRMVLVEGRLKLDRWEDKDGGGRRSKHCVMVDNFTFLGDGKRDDKQAGAAASTPDDDIPF